MEVGQIISAPWREFTKFASFAQLLREYGVDLALIDPSEVPLKRGTPVYTEADADAEIIERRMLLAHIRILFVLDEERILGVIDLVDLIDRAGEAAWEHWKGGRSWGRPPL